MVKVDKELSTWIIDNAARGCVLDSMVDSMAAVGHPRDYARAAIAQVLAVTTPEPIPSGAPNFVDAGDRRISVLAQLKAPRVIVFGDVLDADDHFYAERLIKDVGTLESGECNPTTVIALKTRDDFNGPLTDRDFNFYYVAGGLGK